MSDEDFRKLVLDGIKDLGSKQDEMQRTVTELSTEFKLHQQESNHRWETIARLDTEQNAILAEHRSTGLAQQEANEIARRELDIKIDNLDKKFSKRYEELSEPQKFWGSLKKLAMYVSAIGGAILTITAIITKFMGVW